MVFLRDGRGSHQNSKAKTQKVKFLDQFGFFGTFKVHSCACKKVSINEYAVSLDHSASPIKRATSLPFLSINKDTGRAAIPILKANFPFGSLYLARLSTPISSKNWSMRGWEKRIVASVIT